MMWFWIVLAVWIVGMWPTAYIIGRYGEGLSDEQNTSLVLAWPLTALFALILLVPEWFAELGEKHAQEKGE